ncbi:RDD family protein [Yinghuangia seranimata]|uniref:RDD family protein n=1 Tax=Yinghuangia seranimata TaxID=408067 RepID=UPI00248BACDE|nr:RDD family protein [Yinghuangia seranimata]MDI2132672.1 RDD family protein [Yinghuangia seranimata]
MTFPQQPEPSGTPQWASGPAFGGGPQAGLPGAPPQQAPGFVPGPVPGWNPPPVPQAPPAEAIVEERELPPASRLLRLLARTVDYLLATALVVPLWFAAYHYLQGKAADLQNTTFHKVFWDLLAGNADAAKRAPLEAVDGLWAKTKLLLLLLVLAHLLVPVLYDWLAHARWGRTLGKAMVGVKATPVDGGSHRLGLARAGRRTLVAVFVPWAALTLMWYEIILRNWSLAGLCGAVSLIGFVDPLAVLGPRRRTWHDRIAGTAVVNVKPLARARGLGRDAGQAVRQAYQSSAVPGQAARLGDAAGRQARDVRERLRRPRG